MAALGKYAVLHALSAALNFEMFPLEIISATHKLCKVGSESRLQTRLCSRLAANEPY